MGLFDGVENKQASHNGGNYVKPGHYLAILDRVKSGESAQGKGDYVAVEMRILEALPDGDLPLDDNFNKLTSDDWHRAGETVTHLMMSKHQSFLGNMKALVANIGGIPESEVTSDHCEKVTGGLFDGLFIEFQARTIKTRQQKPFTVVGYTREVPAAEIKERVNADTLDIVLGKGKIDEVLEAESAG